MLGLSIAREFDREVCYNKTQTMLDSNTSMAMDTSIFITNLGQLMSNASNPWLTIPACNSICGSQMGFYSDTPSRLLTWLIPTILLVTNMQFALFGKERFLMVVHLFGDPVDSLFSLLSKIDSWNRWSYICQGGFESNVPTRSFALVMSTIEEVVPSSHMNFQPYQSVACSCSRQCLGELYQQSAVEILDRRAHGTARTCFSIILYIVGVVSAFVPSLSGSTSPSGGKIAPAMLLSWLLPTILVSNVVGQFNSSRDSLQIVLRLKERIENLKHTEGCSRPQPLSPDWEQYLNNPNWEQHLNPLPWSGGIYSFRLRNRIPDFGQGHSLKLLIVISLLPLIFSFVAAFLVLYSAPTYLSCRHFMIISAFLAWLLSPIITWSIAKSDFRNDKIRFYLVLAKDTIIGVPILVLLAASSCGLFNNCYCWSGILTPGHEAAVVLNPAQHFARNNQIIYPAIVATSLFLQFCVFIWIRWIGRAGFSMMQMNERERGEALARWQPFAVEASQEMTSSSESKHTAKVVTEGWDGSSCIV
jgi:hypothetical protein